MASSTRRERTEARAPRQKAPSMLPVIATIGVVVLAALVVTVMTQKAKEKENAASSAASGGSASVESNPFAHIDTSPERLMRKGSGSSLPATTHDAPPGLADAQVFQDARVIAAEGKALVEAALAAEKAGDVETWRAKAIEGRDKLEHVIEMTADWEIDLIQKWGSSEAQLKQISAEIDTWRKLLNKVRKVR